MLPFTEKNTIDIVQRLCYNINEVIIMKTATVNIYEKAIPTRIQHTAGAGCSDNRLPNNRPMPVPRPETQAAFDETEAMIRGEIPKPPYQSTKDFFAEMRQ